MSYLKGIVALSISAALLAACSNGGSGTNAVPPVSQSGSHAPIAQARGHVRIVALPRSARRHFRVLTNHRIIVFHSLAYWRAHPELRRAMASSNLQYNGGPVQTAPTIDLVYWGWQGPSDPTNDPDDVYDYLNGFFNSIGGGGWINTDTQYYDTLNGTEYIQNTNPQLGNVVYDTSPPPQNYQDSDVQNEALAAENYLGDYSVNVNYIVITPTGYTTSGFGSQWCAYHSTTTDSNGNTVSYTDLPYIPDAGSSCGQGSVNSPGTNDGVSIVGGHEEAETQTDPQLNAWLDSSGEEIGDKCAWQNLENNGSAGGYPTQPLWDNAIGGCAQSGP